MDETTIIPVATTTTTTTTAPPPAVWKLILIVVVGVVLLYLVWTAARVVYSIAWVALLFLGALLVWALCHSVFHVGLRCLAPPDDDSPRVITALDLVLERFGPWFHEQDWTALRRWKLGDEEQEPGPEDADPPPPPPSPPVRSENEENASTSAAARDGDGDSPDRETETKSVWSRMYEVMTVMNRLL